MEVNGQDAGALTPEQLLKDQKDDGSWGGGVVDTCFAILFLKRATERLPTPTKGW